MRPFLFLHHCMGQTGDGFLARPDAQGSLTYTARRLVPELVECRRLSACQRELRRANNLDQLQGGDVRSDHHTYIRAFDGLRGIAVLPVVLLHVGVQVLPNGLLLRELTRGWYGVDLFFVLSGFLITTILLGELKATGTIDIKRFYFRRFRAWCRPMRRC